MIHPATRDSTPAGLTLTGTLEQLQRVESQHLPDAVVPLREVTWTPEGLIAIPGHGQARPNEWAKTQIGNLLGIRFDRWFQAASPEVQSDEMIKRLRRAGGKVRLRLAHGTMGTVLRAVVSPAYSPVADSMVLESLAYALMGVEARVHRLDVTDRMTSIMVCVGEPQTVGGIVGSIWGAVTIVNSGVAWRNLSVSTSLLRRICGNGMRAPVFDAEIMRVRHRGLEICSFRHLLRDRMQSLPADLSQAIRNLEASTTWKVINVEAEARALLREKGMIRGHLNGILAAFRQEPAASVFGLSQAITLHAQRVQPEDRVELEALAGDYVVRSSP